MIDHYRVVRLLGRGGMADVYLARDMILGRKVALKLLRRQSGILDEDDRFLFEARATASFSHPNIVAVHGIGEYEGRMFIALEYLEGHTLRDRLRDSRVAIREALRITLAIGEALREAHRHGILHRDLKPSNVIIGRDARLRVVDFGLAKRVQSAETLMTPGDPDGSGSIDSLQTLDEGVLLGTPAYMSPEQWNGLPCSEASDIWSLGLILYEMVSGDHPLRDCSPEEIGRRMASRTPLPPIAGPVPQELLALVGRCLDFEPAARPDAKYLCMALDRMLSGKDAEGATDSPFRGLLPYGERHADHFHGRDSEIGAFVERLREQAVLPIVGPSGSGKSSFVQAGVIPRLREQNAWTVLRLRPGRAPLDRLVRSLLGIDPATTFTPRPPRAQPESATDDPPTIADRRPRRKTTSDTPPASQPTLAASVAWTGDGRDSESTGSHRLADDAVLQATTAQLRESPSRLALWLNQLAERTRTSVLLFIDQLEELYSLVPDEQERRAFLDALCLAADDPKAPVRVVFTLREDFLGRAAETPLVREVLAHVTVLRRPEPGSLREILTRPVQTRGYAWEDDALVSEMVEQVSGEPAALALLQFTAQMVWERRDRERHKLTRAAYESVGGVAGSVANHADTVLSTLTAQETRTARDILLRLISPDATRVAVPRALLLEGLAKDAAGVLERLTETRTVVVHGSRRDGHGAEVEIAHESLLRTWERLRRWIEESREEIVFVRDLQQAAEAWQRRGEPVEGVWRGDVLRDARKRWEGLSTPLPEAARKFLQLGLRVERRRIYARRFALVGVIALLAMTATAFWVAWRIAAQQRASAELQRTESEKRRQEAVSQRAESLWQGARADLRREDMLGARAKLRTALEVKDAPEIRALWWQVHRSELLWSRHMGADLNVAVATRDGGLVAVGTADGTVYLVDGEGMEQKALRGQTDQITSIALSDDGTWAAVGTWSGAVDVWHVSTRKRTAMPGHRGIVRRIAFAPSGRLFASGGMDRTLRVWDAQEGTVVRVIEGLTAEVRHLAFKPDGTVLVSADLEGKVQAWNLQNGSPLFQLQAKGARPAVRWTGDGRALVVAGGGRAILVDGATGREIESVATESVVLDLAERDDGRMVGVVAAGPQDIRVSDMRTGALLAALPTGGNLSDKVTLAARGTRVLVVGEDQDLRMWSLRPPAGLAGRARPAAGPLYALAIHPDGSRLAAAGRTRNIQFFDTATGRLLESVPGHIAAVNDLAFSRDGKRLASASWDNSLRIWDTDTRKSEVLWSNSSWPVVATAFSPDGTRIAMSSGPSGIRIVDLPSGAPRTLSQAHDYTVFGLDYSPDGRMLASGGGTTVRLWDAATDQPLRTLQGHQATLRKVRFSPDGKLLASGADDGTVRLWETSTGRALRVVGPMPERIVSLGFHPDGHRIGVTLSGGGVGVWDLEGRRVGSMRGHRGDANTVVFGNAGRWMITSGDDATIRAWDLETGRAAWFASAVVGVALQAYTHEGWVALDPAVPARPSSARWRAVVEQTARLARESSDRRTLCIASHDDTVRGWDLDTDQGSEPASVPLVRDVVATSRACVARSAGGEATLRPLAGASTVLSSNATAINADGDTVLVAADHDVRVFAASGRQIASFAADVGVTALARLSSWIAVGYRDGNIELLSESASRPARRVVFDDIPAVAVERIVSGPPGTLVAGFVNGVVGVWDTRTGAALLRLQLHGPVTWLACPGHTLYAVTELGDREVVDLDVLVRDYCDLMREVWKEVPVVWVDGRAVLGPSPEHHPCLP